MHLIIACFGACQLHSQTIVPVVTCMHRAQCSDFHWLARKLSRVMRDDDNRGRIVHRRAGWFMLLRLLLRWNFIVGKTSIWSACPCMFSTAERTFDRLSTTIEAICMLCLRAVLRKGPRPPTNGTANGKKFAKEGAASPKTILCSTPSMAISRREFKGARLYRTNAVT